MRWLISFLLFVFLGAVNALSSTGNRLLVVTEKLEEKSKYPKFWADLEARGFKISFESPKDDKLALFKLGERAYDHIIIFSPQSKGLGSALSPSILLDFMKKDGNILLSLTGNSATSIALSSLLLELDIQLSPDRNSLVVDHFNYDILSAAEKHDVLVLPPVQAYRADVKDYFSTEGPIAIPRAVSQMLGPASPLLTPIIKAPDTAYTYNPKDDAETVEEPFAVGNQLSLVTTFQARNSARFSVLGSMEMLEDKWFDAKVKVSGKESKTSNRELAKKLSAWTFHEVGVLKVGRLQHHLNEGSLKDIANETAIGSSSLNPKIYRIKNDVVYSIELSEYNMDHLEPYIPPSGDAVQLEFTMLSPFHRLPLSPAPAASQPNPSNSTLYTTSFTLPDQHGIFNFRVNYKRPFLSNVDEKRTVTVRHFAHDEWPRSYVISGAWVWIAGIAVTVTGWISFVGLWLYSEPADESRKTKKSQ